MAARDPIGVKQMYWGTDKDGRKLFRFNWIGSEWIHFFFVFSSEMKVIEDICVELNAFPPGHFYTPKLGFVRYYEVVLHYFHPIIPFYHSLNGSNGNWPTIHQIWLPLGIVSFGQRKSGWWAMLQLECCFQGDWILRWFLQLLCAKCEIPVTHWGHSRLDWMKMRQIWWRPENWPSNLAQNITKFISALRY